VIGCVAASSPSLEKIAPTMSRQLSGLFIALALAMGVVGLAFLIAPHSCNGGMDVYVWVGGAVLLVLLAVPFVTRIGRSMVARIACSVGFLALGLAAWLVGLFGANVRFICGLGYL
jgi:hypothetical protein